MIIENHSSPLSGHFGIKNTIDKIKRKYYWPKLNDQVTNYVKNCHQCQLNKINRKQKPGYCDLLEVDQPFSGVEIDITGPYEETPRRNKYIVAAIDCLTKYTEMRAIPSQDKYTIANFIYEDILTRHSPPLVLQSDRGGAFMSDIVQALIEVYPPTIQNFRSGYNPSVQGQIERTNASIKEYLRTNIISEEDWDLMVPSCRYSLNTKLNSTTKRSPFELLYNRQPFTFDDINMNFKPKSDKKTKFILRGNENQIQKRNRKNKTTNKTKTRKSCKSDTEIYFQSDNDQNISNNQVLQQLDSDTESEFFDANNEIFQIISLIMTRTAIMLS